MTDGLQQKIPPQVPEQISGLVDLAFNLWWSWHPSARMLFKMLNRAAWKLSGHNPVRMLHEIDKETYEKALADPAFLRHYESVITRFRTEVEDGQHWFAENVTGAQANPIAFFSAEFGLHRSLPFYAGGLGFLAGDFIKQASDLAFPMVGVGFMYPEGYLRQRITAAGLQQDEDEPLDRANAAISRVMDGNGIPLLVKVPFVEPPIYIGIWKVQAGKVPVYLLDTDIDQNDPWNRKISSHLYIGDVEQRLRQEIVLGLGGSEALDALGITHSVLHLNEGHPAFAILEKIRDKVAAGADFEKALEETANTTVFTTHTPVAAGTDVFPFELMEKYFTSCWPELGCSRERFFSLGINPEAPRAGFNMTVFALRCSSYRNAVSSRHGQVARKLWHGLWPDRAENDVPIDHVTNGVHVPTWIEPKMERLFTKHLGYDWLSRHDSQGIWELVDDIPDVELWNTHYWLKMKLILRILERGRQRWIDTQPDPRIILSSGVLLDPNTLTIGFARRFTAYKRAGLLFLDPDRLKRILNDKWRPVQIIFAGKAHPNDNEGKRILQQIFTAAEDPSFAGRIAFVEDYDEQLAQYLVHGVDVWLNTPRPPIEASGTSGMKAAINGVPSLSVADGWWMEGFNGKNGWIFGGPEDADINNPGANDAMDARDAEALYKILEEQVVPLFYGVGDNGIPHGWVSVMKQAISGTAARFSAMRMVKQYAKKFYQPALKAATAQMTERAPV